MTKEEFEILKERNLKITEVLNEYKSLESTKHSYREILKYISNNDNKIDIIKAKYSNVSVTSRRDLNIKMGFAIKTLLENEIKIIEQEIEDLTYEYK